MLCQIVHVKSQIVYCLMLIDEFNFGIIQSESKACGMKNETFPPKSPTLFLLLVINKNIFQAVLHVNNYISTNNNEISNV